MFVRKHISFNTIYSFYDYFSSILFFMFLTSFAYFRVILCLSKIIESNKFSVELLEQSVTYFISLLNHTEYFFNSTI